MHALWLALVLVVASTATSEAYLLGDEDRAYCWTRPLSSTASPALSPCPAGAHLQWSTPFPASMVAGTTYTVVYNLTTTAANVTSTPHITHANIHSCLQTVGQCTPLIAQTPGLVSHSQALSPNLLPQGGGASTALMSSALTLGQGSWTSIAHVRFEVDGATRVDMAIGTVRTVSAAPSVAASDVSAAAFGGIGALFLLLLAGWAVDKYGCANRKKAKATITDKLRRRLYAELVLLVLSGFWSVAKLVSQVISFTSIRDMSAADQHGVMTTYIVFFFVYCVGFLVSISTSVELAHRVIKRLSGVHDSVAFSRASWVQLNTALQGRLLDADDPVVIVDRLTRNIKASYTTFLALVFQDLPILSILLFLLANIQDSLSRFPSLAISVCLILMTVGNRLSLVPATMDMLTTRAALRIQMKNEEKYGKRRMRHVSSDNVESLDAKATSKVVDVHAPTDPQSPVVGPPGAGQGMRDDPSSAVRKPQLEEPSLPGTVN